ncbi:flavin reductase [Pseudoclavibacter chungangensis]|uniref:Flavin reductase n=2 Tax=Pseudoclavibacter chungangensis TaxID=587635 RepID=A0A7J5BZX0_9MICO|nr:flavin reductase family protein [Pseudoclavibacter chungangensis]KAB1660199.1 flavin reductase [Pseudoclavibacter chungangensis]
MTLATDLATAFKDAFREHPAGTALITAASPSGPVGLTASSVASVGLDPVAISFSVTRATGSAGALLAADTVLVHLLDARHVAIAQQFAVSGGERFSPAQGWETLETGEPFLPVVRTALRARPLHRIPVGASTLVVAEVLDIRSGPAAEPVVYHDRAFRSLGAPH